MSTFKLSFDVMSFQLISKLKILNLHMNMQANTCNHAGRAFRQTKKFGDICFQKIARNSPNCKTSIFVAKRLQNSPDFRNLAINSQIWQPSSRDERTVKFISPSTVLIR